MEGWTRFLESSAGGGRGRHPSVALEPGPRSNRPAAAAELAAEALAEADRLGSSVLRELAEALPVRPAGQAAEPWAPLTAREFEVARLIAGGRTNADIARELNIAPKTVAAHVEHILARLGAERRTEIAAWVGRVATQA